MPLLLIRPPITRRQNATDTAVADEAFTAACDGDDADRFEWSDCIFVLIALTIVLTVTSLAASALHCAHRKRVAEIMCGRAMETSATAAAVETVNVSAFPLDRLDIVNRRALNASQERAFLTPDADVDDAAADTEQDSKEEVTNGGGGDSVSRKGECKGEDGRDGVGAGGEQHC